MSGPTIQIDVVYTTSAEKHYRLHVQFTEPPTVLEAIEASGILKQCPDIDLTKQAVGIYSKQCMLDTPIKTDAQVEIYRPLVVDPKEARRLRAKRKAN